MLVFSTTFPSPTQPLHGLFVQERIRRLTNYADIRVLAPTFLFTARPSSDFRDDGVGLRVGHPRYWYIPGALKFLDGFFLALSAVREVARLRREFDFDLIDAHFTYPDGCAAVLLGKWFRRPVMITERGSLPRLSRNLARRCMADWTIRQADGLIAVSDALARRLRGARPGSEIALIPNGVDAERFRPRPQKAARDAVGCRWTGRLLVSVGHLSRRKGFHRVLRILPRAIEKIPDLAFAVVGGPGAARDNQSELRKLIAKSGLEDRVFMVGAQPPDRVAAWLNAADVFVLASDHEGCPNVVLEALASGKPVVATRVGHVHAMVPDFAGVIVEDAEEDTALLNAILSAFSRSWDTTAIRQHAVCHDWDSVARHVVTHWHRALASFEARSRTAVSLRERISNTRARGTARKPGKE